MSNKTILVPTGLQNNDSLTTFKNENNNISNNDVAHRSTFKRHRAKKNYDYNISENPFITATSPIFKLVIDIVRSNHNETNKIKEEFIQKINSYDELTSKLQLDERESLAVRYIVCTFIDEMMNTTSMGYNNNWSNNSILNIFHNETYGGDNFFHLLDKFLNAPAKYLYILELMYMCMSLGFKGKYRIMNKGDLELNNVQESLYRQIKIVQGKEPVKFYNVQKPSDNKFNLFNKVSYPLLFTIIFFLLFTVYGSLTYALNSQDSEFNYILDADKTYINSNIYQRVAK